MVTTLLPLPRIYFSKHETLSPSSRHNKLMMLQRWKLCHSHNDTLSLTALPTTTPALQTTIRLRTQVEGIQPQLLDSAPFGSQILNSLVSAAASIQWITCIRGRCYPPVDTLYLHQLEVAQSSNPNFSTGAGLRAAAAVVAAAHPRSLGIPHPQSKQRFHHKHLNIEHCGDCAGP